MSLIELASFSGSTGCIEFLEHAGATVETNTHCIQLGTYRILNRKEIPWSKNSHRGTSWWRVGKTSRHFVIGPRVTKQEASTISPGEQLYCNDRFRGRHVVDLNVALAHRAVLTRLFTGCDTFPVDWLRHCLFQACEEGLTLIVDMILTITAGTDLASLIGDDAGNYYQYSIPIELAFHGGHIEIVKLSLQIPRLTVPQSIASELLEHAASNDDDAEFLTSILHHHTYTRDDMRRAIGVARQHRSMTCINLLIQHGANAATTDDSGLLGSRLLKDTDVEAWAKSWLNTSAWETLQDRSDRRSGNVARIQGSQASRKDLLPTSRGSKPSSLTT